jgi:hypothetical protein
MPSAVQAEVCRRLHQVDTELKARDTMLFRCENNRTQRSIPTVCLFLGAISLKCAREHSIGGKISPHSHTFSLQICYPRTGKIDHACSRSRKAVTPFTPTRGTVSELQRQSIHALVTYCSMYLTDYHNSS